MAPERRAMGTAGHYRLAGVVIESDVPLFEDARVAAGAADCRIERLPDDVVLPPLAPAGDGEITVCRSGDTVVLGVPPGARFEISATGDRIRYRLPEGIPEVTLRHLLLDQAVPRALTLRGLLVFHASAVETPWGAVGFLGASGTGKSTLAAALAREGWPHLSDDSLVLEPRPGEPSAIARASYRGIRLWPEGAHRLGSAGDGAPVAHFNSKRLFGPADVPGVAFAPGCAPLARLYALAAPEDSDGTVRVEELGPREALINLVRHSFRLGLLEPAVIERDLDRLCRAIPTRLCRTLHYPREHARLDEVRRVLTADLVGEPGRAAGD
jgi:hypothetical protein